MDEFRHGTSGLGGETYFQHLRNSSPGGCSPTIPRSPFPVPPSPFPIPLSRYILSQTMVFLRPARSLAGQLFYCGWRA